MLPLLATDALNPVIFFVGRVHKQVTEIARSFGAFHRLADVVHVLLILRVVRHVHGEPCMAAVDVILATEPGGGLDQQGGRDGGQVLRQAVNLLVQVRLHRVEDAALTHTAAWSCRNAQTGRYQDPHRAGYISPATAPATEYRRAGWCASPDRGPKIRDAQCRLLGHSL